tara:strand:+ start:51 stop:455 length:405 start_codon:yes stop_codon:yes gene_type:complete
MKKKDMFMEWEEGVYDGGSDPEFIRVQAILNPILSDLDDDTEMGYHFSECEGHDDEHFDELMKDSPDRAEDWHTIYDSCYFPVSDGGSYSIIEVAQSENRDYFYLSVSLAGCQGASALTEYFKVPMTGKWSWSA